MQAGKRFRANDLLPSRTPKYVASWGYIERHRSRYCRWICNEALGYWSHKRVSDTKLIDDSFDFTTSQMVIISLSARVSKYY